MSVDTEDNNIYAFPMECIGKPYGFQGQISVEYSQYLSSSYCTLGFELNLRNVKNTALPWWLYKVVGGGGLKKAII